MQLFFNFITYNQKMSHQQSRFCSWGSNRGVNIEFSNSSCRYQERFPYYFAYPPYFPPQTFMNYVPQNLFVPNLLKAGISSEENIKMEANNDFYISKQQEIDKQSCQNIATEIKKQKMQALRELKLKNFPSLGSKKAQYFDPLSAPTVTSKKYNSITNLSSEEKTFKRMSKITRQQVNEMQFQEEDSDPFIVFHYKRLRNRHKRFVQAPTNQDKKQNHEDQSSSISICSQFDEKSKDFSEFANQGQEISKKSENL